MSLPYNPLNTFLLSIKLGTLKRTSDHLCLTESAVSHQLKRLEEQLGYSLFYKEGRQLKPTKAGVYLAKKLAQPFQEIDEVLSQLSEQLENSIHLYCLPSLFESWVLPRILTFTQRFPKIQFSIHYQQSAPNLLDESSLLIGCRENASLPTEHIFHPIFSGETQAVCSPIYLNQHNIPSPASLQESVLLHDHSEVAWQIWFKEQNLPYSERGKFVYEDFHLLKMATLAAQGVALCPTHLVQNEIKSGKLHVLFPHITNKERHYGIEYHHTHSQSIQHLIRFLKSEPV